MVARVREHARVDHPDDQRPPLPTGPGHRGRPVSVSDMPIRDYIAEFLRTHCDLEFDTIAPEATPAELGLDSLTVLSIIVLVEKKYGVELPDRRLAFARTFAELMELLGVPVAPVS